MLRLVSNVLPLKREVPSGKKEHLEYRLDGHRPEMNPCVCSYSGGDVQPHPMDHSEIEPLQHLPPILEDLHFFKDRRLMVSITIKTL